MPIYEYCCKDCDHEFEALQKIADAPLSYCEKCDKHSLKKKVSAAAFRLKGGGWYETDFKSGNKKNLASADSKAKDAGSKNTARSKAGSNGGSQTATKKASS